jgi:hypothetical protein
MRAQKMREEAAEKERDEHFNNIRPVIPTKQEWRVKEKANTPAPTTSDDDMDLLDDDEAHWSRTGLRHRLAWTSTWCSCYRPSLGVPRRRLLRCVSALKRLCSRSLKNQASTWSRCTFGHINRKPISSMLVNGGTAINLMPYSVFKKLGRKDNELVKTKLTINGLGGNPMEAWDVIFMELTVGSKSLATAFFVVKVQGNYSVILGRDWIHAHRYIPSSLH